LNRNLSSTILDYLENSHNVNHRYKSWNHCFAAFGNSTLNKTELSLNLGFYLASWGMYRGSSQLLQKNYLVHEGAVIIIENYEKLRCGINNEVNEGNLDKLLLLINNLKMYYTSVNVTPTNTLISKILLGTLGCLPAFDRYFIEGVKSENFRFKSLNKKSLENLFIFLSDNKEELLDIQEKERINKGMFYPKMKLIDMYFWNHGYNTN